MLIFSAENGYLITRLYSLQIHELPKAFQEIPLRAIELKHPVHFFSTELIRMTPVIREQLRRKGYYDAGDSHRLQLKDPFFTKDFTLEELAPYNSQGSVFLYRVLPADFWELDVAATTSKGQRVHSDVRLKVRDLSFTDHPWIGGF